MSRLMRIEIRVGGTGSIINTLLELLTSVSIAEQVLSIGETVEEVNDSGFEGKVPTIRCQLMADDSMLQVRLPPHRRT